jgi:hypothetical protein
MASIKKPHLFMIINGVFEFVQPYHPLLGVDGLFFFFGDCQKAVSLSRDWAKGDKTILRFYNYCTLLTNE